MKDVYVIYMFIGLMSLNLLASFLYMMGFDHFKTAVRRAYNDSLRRK